MRILIRTSKWAIWSRRFGSFALPLAILPVFLHREALISSRDFVVIEAIAAGFALLALVLGLGAFARLWVTGDQGWGKATWGVVFAVLCLVPFGWLGYMAWRYPYTSEVSTDYTDPPALISEIVVTPPSREQQARLATLFPNAQTRSYPIEATQMFEIVSQLVAQKGWDIRVERAPPTALDSGVLNAIALTLIGFRDEVALRVSGDAQGSSIAMRSVPLSGMHDFGENGHRIEDFLVALDDKVTLLLRDAPQTAAAPDEAAPATETDEAD